jgi:DNA repair exonuclease SbcCD nuclease subunit
MLRKTLQRIARLAVELQVDAICCGGDLYEHERFSPDTGEFLRQTFAEIAPLPVLIAPGNHDWYGPASLYQQIAWSPNVHVFTEDRLTPLSLTDGFTLWGGAHRVPANTRNFLDGFSLERGGINLALFHGSEQAGFAIQGQGKVAHAPFRAEQIPASGLDHALLGHFHTPTDGRWHTYPGNPDPLEFGEQGERGAVLVSVAEDGNVSRTRYQVASSMVSDITVHLDSVTHSDQILERVREALSSCEGFVRVTLTGEIDPNVDLRPEDLRPERVAPRLAGVLVRLGTLNVTYDFEALAKEHTIRGQFVRDVLDTTDLTEERRRRVLMTGLRALDGRSDLEVR